MPYQFQQAEESAPLRTGVPEPLAAPVATQANGPRYTPDEVQRIIAEAARLQALYRETLSQREIEALAQDIGIAPEFVRQAIEQDGAAQAIFPRRRKRLPKARLKPLPFRTVAKTAILPILYACLLIPITSWQPESNFANWFLFLYMVLPPLLAFVTGFWQRKIRLSVAVGAFWGLSILFALSLPNSIKLYQNMDNTGSVELLQVLSETGMILAIFLAWGAFFGVSGALMRRGGKKSQKWYKNRHIHKAGAANTAFGL